jgi:hypothetical protein
VKSQHSFLKFRYLTSFFHHFKSIGFKRIKNKCYLWRQFARKCTYLSRTVFRTFLREFESAETFPGFAQLLGEKLDLKNDAGKKSLNGESLEMNDVISRQKTF